VARWERAEASSEPAKSLNAEGGERALVLTDNWLTEPQLLADAQCSCKTERGERVFSEKEKVRYRKKKKEEGKERYLPCLAVKKRKRGMALPHGRSRIGVSAKVPRLVKSWRKEHSNLPRQLPGQARGVPG